MIKFFHTQCTGFSFYQWTRSVVLFLHGFRHQLFKYYFLSTLNLLLQFRLEDKFCSSLFHILCLCFTVFSNRFNYNCLGYLLQFIFLLTIWAYDTGVDSSVVNTLLNLCNLVDDWFILSLTTFMKLRISLAKVSHFGPYVQFDHIFWINLRSTWNCQLVPSMYYWHKLSFVRVV